MKSVLKNQVGYTMVVAIMLVFLVSIVGLSLITLNTNSMKLSKNEEVNQSVYYVAEAGIDVKTAKIIEFMDTAKQETDKKIAACNSIKEDSDKPTYCLQTSYFNDFFLGEFLTNFKTDSDIMKPLTSDNLDFNTPKSSADVKFTCKQLSTLKDCKNFTLNNHDKLTVIMESTGIIDGHDRVIKREIELSYAATIRNITVTPPPTTGNPNNPVIPAISINNPNPNSGQVVLPIYQFDSKAGLPEVNFNSGNWKINGKLIECEKGNKKCNFNVATHEESAINILKDNYSYYKTGCSNSNQVKLKTGEYTEDTAIYVSSSDSDIRINNKNNNAQVDIIFCNNTAFNKKFELTAEIPEKVNIYVVSDTVSLILQQIVIKSNLIYAPNITIEKINSNGNKLCTHLFVNKIKQINGAGVSLNDSCSGNIPSKIIPDNNNSNKTQINTPTQKHLTIISTIEV